MFADENPFAIQQEPWMKECVMELVTPQTLDAVIDACCASAFYALDLETTGLNSRAYYGVTKDQIVGVCLSPDGVHGYYIPLRHRRADGTPYDANIPLELFRVAFSRLMASDARAVFHNAKFDQEFLHFAGWPDKWDNSRQWEDTLILAYLRNTRERRKGLKHLSEKPAEEGGLGMKMIELKDLFPDKHPKNKLDFSLLDPEDPPTVWYGASDAICTWRLYERLHQDVLMQPKHPQKFIYDMEKKCSVATRWMERNGIYVDKDKVKELITLGQVELVEVLVLIYKEINEALGRKVMPAYLKRALKSRVVDDPDNPLKTQFEEAKAYCHATGEDRLVGAHEVRGKEYRGQYDILSAQQIGELLEELNVPNLPRTEKSKQVDTSQAAIAKLIDEWGSKYPFLNRIRRLRELLKALSTYLLPLWTDACSTLGTIKVNFVGTKVDTGRFSTPKSKPGAGGTTFFLQGIPAPYVKDRPECMLRLRECIRVRDDGKFMAAIDFSGVELRIGTNLSGEPAWMAEYFRCSGCGHQFSRGDGTSTPELPPPFCPKCGSDKIGDIHTLTGLAVYGPDALSHHDWKEKRQRSKGANFALLYGGSANAVRRSTNCEENEAHRIHRGFLAKYTTMTGWWKRQHAMARNYKYVTTAFGRRYPVPDIDDPNRGFVKKAERNSVNGPIQGTSADITKMAMWYIYKMVKDKGWEQKLLMIITMHDELVFEIDKDIAEDAIAEICRLMTRNNTIMKMKWPVPLAVDVDMGYTWKAPWKLFEYQHKGGWPNDLKPWFNVDGGGPSGGSDEGAPAGGSDTGTNGTPAPPTTGAFTYGLTKPISYGLIERVALCITRSKGTQPLYIKELGGDELPWPAGTMTVDARKFQEMASLLGI